MNEEELSKQIYSLKKILMKLKFNKSSGHYVKGVLQDTDKKSIIYQHFACLQGTRMECSSKQSLLKRIKQMGIALQRMNKNKGFRQEQIFLSIWSQIKYIIFEICQQLEVILYTATKTKKKFMKKKDEKSDLESEDEEIYEDYQKTIEKMHILNHQLDSFTSNKKLQKKTKSIIDECRQKLKEVQLYEDHTKQNLQKIMQVLEQIQLEITILQSENYAQQKPKKKKQVSKLPKKTKKNVLQIKKSQQGAQQIDSNQKDELNKKLEAEKQMREKIQKEKEELQELKLCIICYNNPKNCLFMPCGHVATCNECKQVKECPICRAKIKKRHKAFL